MSSNTQKRLWLWVTVAFVSGFLAGGIAGAGGLIVLQMVLTAQISGI